MLKIIYDPKYQTKWLVDSDGITLDKYYGAVEWLLLCDRDNKPKIYNPLLPLLTKVTQKQKSLPRVSRDIVRPLNLQEYQTLNKLFQTLRVKYNKKTNKLICSN